MKQNHEGQKQKPMQKKIQVYLKLRFLIFPQVVFPSF